MVRYLTMNGIMGTCGWLPAFALRYRRVNASFNDIIENRNGKNTHFLSKVRSQSLSQEDLTGSVASLQGLQRGLPYSPFGPVP